uniref:CNNM transmembrane domain-containing protein n=1 Tax=Setaria digitata TaxID=48799 RepID=A0A915PKT1_9BILA
MSVGIRVPGSRHMLRGAGLGCGVQVRGGKGSFLTTTAQVVFMRAIFPVIFRKFGDKGMQIWIWRFYSVFCIAYCFLPSFCVLQKQELKLANDSGIITTEKKTHLAGIRVEGLPSEDNGFVGYNDKEVSIVQPDVPVRVVLFGFGMDDIALVVFTRVWNNCSMFDIEIVQADFTVQTDKRVVVKAAFPDSADLYYVCVKQKPEKNEKEEIEQHFVVLNDLRATISTEIPPRQYYLPMGIQIAVICCLLVLSGLFSGLNLGLMALTPQELMLIQKSGSKKERAYAEVILPVRRSGNLLLCALLIGNVCVNSAISILFDDLTSGYVALITSSAGIVVFGEIFPQSLCVKKGLAVGARTIWITRFFMVLTFPLAYPISKILDVLLGDEVISYDRKRLMELIKMSTRDERLAEELKIAVGAMEISDKTVSDVMTKIDDVFMLPDTTVLNTKTVAEILRMGYTRIPVFSGDRNTVVALLFVKDLALLDPDDNFTIQTVCGFHEHPLRFVMEDTPLRVMLEEFKKGDYHLAMVQHIVESEEMDPAYELVGIVTLEDIVEEILQAEIVDETDVVTDNVHRIRRRNAQALDLAACLLEEDGPSRIISVQMQLVTMQWLATNQHAFNPDLISPNILEKLIKQHVRRVEFSHLPDMNDPKTVIPRTAKLYTKQEPSERFILILEGRAMVTIGQNEMTFEAGPWHCFGGELLDQLVTVAQQQYGITGAQLQQQGIPYWRLSQCYKLSVVLYRTDIGISCGGTQVTFSRNSLSTSGISPSEPVKKSAISFTPDFSAVVRDDCTYLEITAQTYLLAYKSTLISKGSRGLLASTGGEDGGIVATANGQKMLSRSSLDEHSLLLGSPLLDNSQTVKRLTKPKILNGRKWRKRCRSETSDSDDLPVSPNQESIGSSNS